MFIEIKLLVESPIIVILSVCIKVSCTYFVTPSYTIQLIAILAGDVSNDFPFTRTVVGVYYRLIRFVE